MTSHSLGKRDPTGGQLLLQGRLGDHERPQGRPSRGRVVPSNDGHGYAGGEDEQRIEEEHKGREEEDAPEEGVERDDTQRIDEEDQAGHGDTARSDAKSVPGSGDVVRRDDEGDWSQRGSF